MWIHYVHLTLMWESQVGNQIIKAIQNGVKENKTDKDWFQDCCKNWSLNPGFCLMVVKAVLRIAYSNQKIEPIIIIVWVDPLSVGF